MIMNANDQINKDIQIKQEKINELKRLSLKNKFIALPPQLRQQIIDKISLTEGIKSFNNNKSKEDIEINTLEREINDLRNQALSGWGGGYPQYTYTGGGLCATLTNVGGLNYVGSRQLINPGDIRITMASDGTCYKQILMQDGSINTMRES